MATRTFTHWHKQGFERAAEHYLRECYRKKKRARADDFAQSIDLTPEYASFLGAKLVGGLRAYLRKRQMEQACKLLRRTPYSIEEIASRRAFGTRSTMHRWFVKAYGMGPEAYRSHHLAATRNP